MALSCRGWAVCVGTLLAVLPATARAQGDDEARRTALYKEGVDAAVAGHWVEAEQRFREALVVRSSPKVLFSLAQAEEHVGQVATAHADYSQALDAAKAAGEHDVVTAAVQALAAIAPRVPHVRVVVIGAPGATASLDGHGVPIGTATPVDPGTHRLVVSAPGRRDSVTSVAIGERQQLDVPVRLESEPGAPGPEPARAETAAPAGEPAEAGETPASGPRAGVPWRTIGLVTAAAGVVGLGVGTYFGLEAKSKLDQSNAGGCRGNDCTPAAAATRRDALSAANVSTIAFVAGGVLAAGGVVLWLVAPSGEADHGVGVTPVALAGPKGGAGLVVAGGWR